MLSEIIVFPHFLCFMKRASMDSNAMDLPLSPPVNYYSMRRIQGYDETLGRASMENHLFIMDGIALSMDDAGLSTIGVQHIRHENLDLNFPFFLR